MSTPSEPPPSDIPTLSGHYRATLWYFLRCALGMLAGFGVFCWGLKVELVALQIAGGVIAFGAFLAMFGAMSRARSARCPSCSTMMAQGWNAAQSQSDGIFVCPQCQGRWRTRAVWGYE